MSLLDFQNISLMLGGKSIVDDMSVRIDDNDRIGLIGPNGSGKSTLLKLMAGEQTADGGQILRTGGMRLGYLRQDVVLESGNELLDFVLASVPGRKELDAALSSSTAELEELSAGPGAACQEEHIMELAGRVAELHEEVSDFDTHYSEFEAKRILSGLGFVDSDHARDLGEFSGGWMMRAVLAALLFQRPDLLLLDEPTNHLDMPSVAWFSSFLKRYNRAFILISHDREFLNEQINRVLSFEPEGMRSYPGDYDKYLKQREEERVLLQNRAANLAKEREHLESFISRFRAKASKAAQVQSRVRALEKMEKVELYQEHATINFRFPPSERAGQDVLRTEELCKNFGDNQVLNNVELLIRRGDRIGIIGKNGAGKTTLLRILASELEASSGEFTFGHNAKVGYYAQHHAESLHGESTVYDEVHHRAKDGSPQRTRAVLGAMLFGDKEIEKKIDVLSGGERARVALAQLLINPGNVLLMDEPTNHLDLVSSERLGEALETFDGTLLFVSHNRGFVRALATQIWSVEDGKVEVYPGTFDEYLQTCATRENGDVVVHKAAAEPTTSKGKPAMGQASGGSGRNSQTAASRQGNESVPPKKRSRAEEKARKRAEAEARQKKSQGAPLRKQVETLEDEIAALEKLQSQRDGELGDPKLYDDPVRRNKLLEAYQRDASTVEKKTAKWTRLQEDLERGKR
ncbi:MAG: ABC-F family ATP-binding cassette domain-containing protein [Polyangiaceae bacterium]|nr:ABC-F family ATP-binding cassette domain-containing protein [Polyangiaceae bacterium]